MKKFNVEFELTEAQIDFIKNLKLEKNGSFKYIVKEHGMYMPLLYKNLIMEEEDEDSHGNKQYITYSGYEIKKQLELEESEKI